MRPNGSLHDGAGNGTQVAQVEESLVGLLADLITEAVAAPSSPAERADVLAEIVGYAVDAVRWRNEPDGDPQEERSLDRVLHEVESHRRRMAGSPA